MNQILNDAADLIQIRGWWNGKDVLGKRLCAIMAIVEASNLASTRAIPVVYAFEQKLGMLANDWNDNSDRQTVVNTLREGI